MRWRADAERSGPGSLGCGRRSDADGAVGILHRVSDAHGLVVELAGGLSAGLQQSKRTEQSRSSGHLDAVDPLGAPALLARHGDSLRRRQSGAAGHGQSHLRGRAAAGAAGDSRGSRQGMAGRPSQRCDGATARRAVDSGHRHHDQAAVRQAGRGGSLIQPEEARTPLAQLPHLPDGRLADGARRGGQGG